MAVHGVEYVYWSAGTMGVVPDGVVTVTSTAPSACAGVTAVIVVSLTTAKLAAGLVPKCTAVAPVKPEPEMVTAVPPAGRPPLGVKPVMLKNGPTVKDHV